MGRCFYGLRVTRIRFASTWQRRSRHHRRVVVVGKKLAEKDEDEDESEDVDETAAAAVALGVIQT